MTTLVLEPHQDDCALFCAFNAIRERAHIVTVLRSTDEREAEAALAAAHLGCTWEQWPEPVDAPDWDAVTSMLAAHVALKVVERVYAPWPEPGGHPQHNLVAEIARAVVAPERLVFYTTYRYGGPRTTGLPVPFERPWILQKMRALLCYESQVLQGPYRFWTMGLDEYTAPGPA